MPIDAIPSGFIPTRVVLSKNGLAPARQNRWKLIRLQQVEERFESTNTALEKAVEQILEQGLDVSAYAAEWLKLTVRKKRGSQVRPAKLAAVQPTQSRRDKHNAVMRSMEPHHPRFTAIHTAYTPKLPLNYSQGQSSPKEDRARYRHTMRMYVASERVGRQSRYTDLSGIEVDEFACLASEIVARLEMLDQGLKRLRSKMKQGRDGC
jgi:hypothetical protein